MLKVFSKSLFFKKGKTIPKQDPNRCKKIKIIDFYYQLEYLI
ncbi:hypothetical protein ANHYDRO_01226 [Anaerococcus hydrogenalis DSM 7454]|uniref:Uncharacterized protein n=1 Tax=Anaerococcus hydrogenalis DSM 7454 TaxID=561177 RepID=B6W9H2_9FIRM|nr:hypothetical protein ANHYDRO_01226 [Anaerococcus hydrogenalis DSM 7454]